MRPCTSPNKRGRWYTPGQLIAVVSVAFSAFLFLGLLTITSSSASSESDGCVTITIPYVDALIPSGGRYSQVVTLHNCGSTALDFQVKAYAADEPWHPLQFPDQILDPSLVAQVTAAADTQLQYFIYLEEQADLSNAFKIDDRSTRGRFVVEALRSHAQHSQQNLLSYLQQRVDNGTVLGYRSHFIANAVLVTSTVQALGELSERSEIAYIESVSTLKNPEPITTGNIPLSTDWGIARIGADRIWRELGIYGHNVVVANIDTGVLWTHPALVEQYRGNLTGSHDYNWFDATSTFPYEPGDDHGHGTHTMGTIVGGDGGVYEIGVAPKSQWIAAKACKDGTCSSSDLVSAAEWILAPYPVSETVASGQPDLRPHIVNASWGGSGGDVWFQAIVGAWRAAGIFPTFAAGNKGPDQASILSPADYSEAFASGALQSDGSVANFSGRGPSSLTSDVKPEIVAPGVNIRSAWNNGEYNLLSGTSTASPHAAGCAALLLSANPNLSVHQLDYLLTSTATDLGSPGPDSDSGYGLLNCYAAINSIDNTPWLNVQPNEGTLMAGGSQSITLHINSEDLNPGSHYGLVTISFDQKDMSTIHVPVTATIVEPSVAPVANFSASTQDGVVPLEVSFTDLSTGSVDNHLWQFGDGITSSSQYPSHTYTKTGSYTVTLTVDGPVGAHTLSRPDYISAYSPEPPVEISVLSPISGPIGGQITVPLSISTDVSELVILAFQFSLQYDPAVLELIGATVEDTLSATWSVESNLSKAGESRIVTYGSSPLTGTGQLIQLHFNVVGGAGEQSALALRDFLFNEGVPSTVTYDGLFTAYPLFVNGTIRYGRSDVPVADASLVLTGTSTNSSTTREDGSYSLIVMETGDHSVTPDSAPVNQGAISALDAAYIAQCVVKTRAIDDCTIQAGDVSGDGNILAYDAALIARYLVGLYDPPSRVGMWTFSPASREYSALTTDKYGQDFSAYLVGDVTGNWIDAELHVPLSHSHDSVIVSMPNLRIPLHGPIEVPIWIGSGPVNSVQAFQMKVLYDPSILRLIDVQKATKAEESWSLVAKDSIAGDISLVGYSTEPITEAGEVVVISFRNLTESSSISKLRFVDVVLNEGVPIPDTRDGSLLIGSGMPEHTVYLPTLER